MPYSKGGGANCVVVGCHNNQKKLYDWKKSVCEDHKMMLHEDCPCLQPYSMHCIPKNEERRMAWLKAINRKDFIPGPKAQVCSIHFLDGTPSKRNPDPSLCLGYHKEVKPGRREIRKHKLTEMTKSTLSKENIENMVPLYMATPLHVPLESGNGHDEQNKSEVHNEEIIQMCTRTTNETGTQTDKVVCHLEGEMCKLKLTNMHDMETQTVDFTKLEHSYSMSKISLKTTGIQHTTAEFSVGSISTDSDSRFYTGLSLKVLLTLISTLTFAGNNLKFRMPIPDQILLTLVRLRLGTPYKDLARRFCISTQLANKIFIKWICIMAKHLKKCMLWLPRETIRRTMPSSFRELYPHTTCIIDCTEVFIQRPFSLRARAQTWSTYKGHNTAKYLMAIAPNGYIMYISPGYGGRASDNFITKSCGFLNFLLPGDEVMADRGFTIGEDLFSRRVKLNIPSFMKGRTQLSEEECVESRRIASVRIHVERAIGRWKTYRILSNSVPPQSMKYQDKIVQVCGELCNLHGDLIKEDDVEID